MFTGTTDDAITEKRVTDLVHKIYKEQESLFQSIFITTGMRLSEVANLFE